VAEAVQSQGEIYASTDIITWSRSSCNSTGLLHELRGARANVAEGASRTIVTDQGPLKGINTPTESKYLGLAFLTKREGLETRAFIEYYENNH
jgi:hypothetical protein